MSPASKDRVGGGGVVDLSNGRAVRRVASQLERPRKTLSDRTVEKSRSKKVPKIGEFLKSKEVKCYF